MVLDPSTKMLLTSKQPIKPKSYYLVPIVLFFILIAFCASSIVYTVLRINQIQTELDSAKELLDLIQPFISIHQRSTEEPQIYEDLIPDNQMYEYYNDDDENYNTSDDYGSNKFMQRKKRSVEIKTEASSEEKLNSDASEGSLPPRKIRYMDDTPDITYNGRHEHVSETNHRSRSGRLRQRQKHQHMEIFDDSYTSTRIVRGRLVAAHFNGNSSRYIVGQHTNYNGNGHLKHTEQRYIDWVPSEWVQSLGMGQNFKMDNGFLTLKESGLFLIYAQVYYLDYHDMNGYRIFKNSDPILQCTTMTHSEGRVIKGNTCYTSGVVYLNEGDRLSVVDIALGRYSLFEKDKSFFGVVQLSDVNMK
ncbi:PREDICTED: protein eiger [Nicrophorus vespilloides]|uniref:Protein eiger n=1 Tax=Nicrophorus vespilloides TaxID=110193 RepID=A0ABM1MDG1_NICVS|nr:PREDICTED: protein eiger [Nicrophorus vespilloides]